MSYMKMMAMQEARNNRRYSEMDDRYGEEGRMRDGGQMRYSGDMRRSMNEERYTMDEWTGKGYRPQQPMGFQLNNRSNVENLDDYRHDQQGGEKKKYRLTKEQAREWVNSMENEDHEHPEGETWSMEEVKEFAKKRGVETEGQKMIDFYAIMNAMYSDYSKVAEEFGVEKPEFFAAMAKAFLDDKDAVKNKAAVYYHCIVEK